MEVFKGNDSRGIEAPKDQSGFVEAEKATPAQKSDPLSKAWSVLTFPVFEGKQREEYLRSLEITNKSESGPDLAKNLNGASTE